jgi:hypothetical protein
MFRDEGHPNVSLSDWNTFRKEFSPHLFEAVIERSNLSMAQWLVPLARGCVVASPALLQRAGCVPGVRRQRVWRLDRNGAFTRNVDPGSFLKVSQLPGSKLWMVEHNGLRNRILVFLFGSTPVVARTARAATYLADFSLESSLSSLCWVRSTPSDYQKAKQYAMERRFSEIEAQREATAALRRRPRGRRIARLARLAAIEARKKVKR